MEVRLDVIITEWALQSYLDHISSNVFSRREYRQGIRPDVKLLSSYPTPVKFQNDKFWGPATGRGNQVVASGFKMKWHNVGPGRIQLRLAVALTLGQAFLCQAYVKDSVSRDKREAAKLKSRINLIHQNKHQYRGTLP